MENGNGTSWKELGERLQWRIGGMKFLGNPKLTFTI
jgi:hypothetical protein